jgi:hypothetical protein
MTRQDISALATRFKAISLLLINSELINIEEIGKTIEISHILFDSGKYDHCKKSLDLVDVLIVDILEFEEEEKPFDYLQN